MDTQDHVKRCGKKTVSGRPCQKRPIRGAFVCRLHGGAAPQVKLKAEDRIREMVDPALNQLRRLVESAETDAVKLSAIKDVLDRAGYVARQRHELTGADGGPIEIDENLNLTGAELDQYVIAIVERAGARAHLPGQESQPYLAPPEGPTNGSVAH